MPPKFWVLVTVPFLGLLLQTYGQPDGPVPPLFAQLPQPNPTPQLAQPDSPTSASDLGLAPDTASQVSHTSKVRQALVLQYHE